jgi:hypothetical protein
VATRAGERAPAASARDLAGGPVELASLAASRPALLFFWKTGCPACENAAHALPRLAAIPGLAVAAVCQDPEDGARPFAAGNGWDRAGVRSLVDPEPWPASRAFAIRATPTWVLLSPGGRVETVAEGWSRDDANALAARAAALAGAPPATVSFPEDGPGFRPG